MTTTVFNLATNTNDESTYCLPAREALISEAMLRDGKASQLINPKTRFEYANRIIEGRLSLSIGDLGVLKTSQNSEQEQT